MRPHIKHIVTPSATHGNKPTRRQPSTQASRALYRPRPKRTAQLRSQRRHHNTMHKYKLHMYKKSLAHLPSENLASTAARNGKKVKKCAIERARCAPKTEQIGSKSNMNSVHMAHEALSVSQSYIQAKSAASHRAFSNFFARNGASGDAGTRPYGPRARSNTAKRRNGRRDHWPHRPNPFDSFRGPVNDHRASSENPT